MRWANGIGYGLDIESIHEFDPGHGDVWPWEHPSDFQNPGGGTVAALVPARISQ